MSKKTNVLISGGSGMIGREIIRRPDSEKYEVAILSRQKNIKGIRSFRWDIEQSYLEHEAVEFTDILIHLAGENIAGGRWSSQRKKSILKSRVKSTDLLFKHFQKANKAIKVISASAVGYYGVKTSDRIFMEDDAPGNDFISDIVKRWEKAVKQFSSLGSPVTKLRIGIVLSPNGGALKKLAFFVNYGMASILGSGKQWMPWISLEDLAEMFIFLMEKEDIEAQYNAVAPQHIMHGEFMKMLTHSLGKKMFLPKVPPFLLKIILGEMSSILLEGSRISSSRIESEGFAFMHPKLSDYLKSPENKKQ